MVSKFGISFSRGFRIYNPCFFFVFFLFGCRTAVMFTIVYTPAILGCFPGKKITNISPTQNNSDLLTDSRATVRMCFSWRSGFSAKTDTCMFVNYGTQHSSQWILKSGDHQLRLVVISHHPTIYNGFDGFIPDILSRISEPCNKSTICFLSMIPFNNALRRKMVLFWTSRWKKKQW